MSEIKDEIVSELEGNISKELLISIKSLIDEKKYRLAYIELYKIKESSEWSASQRYLDLLEKFWWTYAN